MDSSTPLAIINQYCVICFNFFLFCENSGYFKSRLDPSNSPKMPLESVGKIKSLIIALFHGNINCCRSRFSSEIATTESATDNIGIPPDIWWFAVQSILIRNRSNWKHCFQAETEAHVQCAYMHTYSHMSFGYFSNSISYGNKENRLLAEIFGAACYGCKEKAVEIRRSCAQFN